MHKNDQNNSEVRGFCSKVLLAGEYTVIEGGNSLALPLSSYYGKLIANGKHNHDGLWANLSAYFRNINAPINHQTFENDIVNGLGYESTIPVGYGGGSSGALIAALYDRYSIGELSNDEELKMILGQMESYFHGKSSGIDPLVSYLNVPIMTQGTSLKRLTKEEVNTKDFYLLDSGISRSTAHYVSVFKTEIQNQNKEKLVQLRILNDRLISLLIGVTFDDIDAIMFDISSLQVDLFRPMIPDSILPIWQEGLESREYAMKLCGAGGGGYFLLYTRDKSRVNIDLMPFN